MIDIFDEETRSWVMSRVASYDNKSTERKFADILRRHRLSGWRRHYPLEGSPDFVFPKSDIAIFVDGCFWHGCPIHGRIPQSNREFWEKKLSRNVRRDKRVSRKLRRDGWHVFRFWEHELKGNRMNRKLGKVAKLLGKPFPLENPR